MSEIKNRYDFVYIFDVTNGNPNGDPDAGNLPRLDPETNRGIISDVCLKRKVRNYVSILKGESKGFRIFVSERAVLENKQAEAWDAIVGKGDSQDRSKLPKEDSEAKKLSRWMCDNFFDIRSFGAVMSTLGANCGQVRGPVQFTFAQSVEPILPLEASITRMAITTNKDADSKGDRRTMGRKYLVPYGLYRMHGFVSASLAGDAKNGTGFSEEDLELLWIALENMFDHDRSAARGEMVAQKLILFKHDSVLGRAQAHKLFDRVTIRRSQGSNSVGTGNSDPARIPPARHYSDYDVEVNASDLPSGVTVIERINS